MNTSTQPKGQMRLYACGGAGLNIGQQLEKRRAPEVGFALTEITYIDTSRSNLSADVDSSNCYLLNDLDGSGKVRAENHLAITEHVRAILQQFKPSDINVVLCSAAGGSGSVIGPLLVSQMLADGQCVVVVCIGSADTRLDAENTLKTLKSFESISKMRATPVIMTYIENSRSQSRTSSDDQAVQTIASLCALFSRENRELDSRDLYNWLHFDKVTSFDPRLAALHMVEASSEMPAELAGSIISVATLASLGSETAVFPPPECQFAGFVPAETTPILAARLPLHFAITDGDFTQIAGTLQSFIKDVTTAQQARVVRKPLITPGDRAENSGLVL